jgi:hypothetical protein
MCIEEVCGKPPSRQNGWDIDGIVDHFEPFNGDFIT